MAVGGRDRFINPANGMTYSWPINHSDEEPFDKTRTITRVANTGLVGAVRQQGDDGGAVMTWRGAILHRDQLYNFWAWYRLCQDQTITLVDFDDQRYEVQIVRFAPQRARKAISVGRDPSLLTHYWTYEMAFEVYAFIAGDMVPWLQT